MIGQTLRSAQTSTKSTDQPINREPINLAYSSTAVSRAVSALNHQNVKKLSTIWFWAAPAGNRTSSHSSASSPLLRLNPSCSRSNQSSASGTRSTTLIKPIRETARTSSRSASTSSSARTTHATASTPAEMERAREMMHERQRRMYQARGEKSKNAMYYGAGSVSLASSSSS